MALSPGTKLGPYEVVAPIGAGGMGEVYRAKDTRLDRSVAIKILPAHFSADHIRKQRFEREAKTISSLNHPHICVLYDVGQQDGTDYLVMECVEGETLAKRLEKGPLPMEQVLRYGAQIADALDKAHRSGIVHRDLKPGNIILTPTGAKLLDFGLAKPTAPVLTGVTLSAARPHSPMTEEGMIVGTFQYMSPEQVEGKEVDGRSDIFSLGAVLYEMLTGKRAFEGKSQLSVASAILEKEPVPIADTKPLTSPALNHAITKCLAKLPDERWQSASDLASELKWVAEHDALGSQQKRGDLRYRNPERMVWLALTMLLLVVLFKAYYTRPARNLPIWSYIPPPEKTVFSNFGGQVVVSPDGSKLAFVARTAEGADLLWVRPLDGPNAQFIAGTEGAFYPFWSPDGQYLGFFAGGKLKTVPASGGPVLTVCDAPGSRGAAWSGNGTILFSLTWGGIQSVPASGGIPVLITKLDASRNEVSHRWPYFLPDGRHFLYLASNFTGGPAEAASIYVSSLDSKDSKILFRARSNVVYTSGFLLFVQQGTLMARPFDERRLELKGEAFPVAEHVLYNQVVWRGIFSASAKGDLAYMSASADPGQLFGFDRSGKQLKAVGPQGDFVYHQISPDGQRVASQELDSATANYQIVVSDLLHGNDLKLTFGLWRNQSPIWSPDSQSIAYTSNQNGLNTQLVRRKSDGTGSEEVLTELGGVKFPTSWSSDGKFIAYNSTLVGKSNSELWILPLFGDRKPFAFLRTSSNVAEGRFCPRGGWIAYSSDESGRSEVYVTSFPDHQGKWQVSQSGGSMPRWSRDGRELFFLSPNSQLMVADVNWSGSTFGVVSVHPLFHLRLAPGPPLYDLGPTAGQIGYDVSADGQRILVNSPAENDAAPITVILNWPAKLQR